MTTYSHLSTSGGGPWDTLGLLPQQDTVAGAKAAVLLNHSSHSSRPSQEEHAVGGSESKSVINVDEEGLVLNDKQSRFVSVPVYPLCVFRLQILSSIILTAEAGYLTFSDPAENTRLRMEVGDSSDDLELWLTHLYHQHTDGPQRIRSRRLDILFVLEYYCLSFVPNLSCFDCLQPDLCHRPDQVELVFSKPTQAYHFR